jgi:phenylacetate-CoA ligase
MHFNAQRYVAIELVDPASGAAVPWREGATGEIVYSAFARQATPVLRYRSRVHAGVVGMSCACGRTSPRIRCIGRTDDMLIVRGVNVFPSAVREVVSAFTPAVSGNILVRPAAPGTKQEPPLPVDVELARDAEPDADLADAIRERLRNLLVVQTRVELVPWGSLQRSEYKSKLVEH